MESNVLGTIELQEHQHTLINQFAEVILAGTFQQAIETFEIIFEREPEGDMDMIVFRALCEQKIKEQEGTDMGIKGVFDGGSKGTIH